MSIKAKVSIALKLGFISHQNSIPLLYELALDNESENSYQDLTLSIHTNPPILQDKQWKIDCILPNSHLDIQDKDIKLNVEWLSELTESIICDVSFYLHQGEDVLWSENHSLRALAKNEWGGNSMVELLPSFVMPNDSAVDYVLKATSDVLRRAGKRDVLDGYESKSRTRVWQLASALWTAICNMNISYSLPPASFEQNGQKIRTPSVIMETRIATCLDTTLLFASALEQLGLHPLVLLIEGHSFVGLWLQPQEFAQLVTEDVSAIRKRIDLKEMVVFETTLATQAYPASFTQASETATQHLIEQHFYAAIDIKRARMQKIRPLSLGILSFTNSNKNFDELDSHGFEDAPLLPSFDIDIDIDIFDAKQTTSRLNQWQRKLLDLTTRNRLLHLPENAKGIRLICPNPALLEDKLTEGKLLRIVSLPDLEMGGRDTELYRQQTHENLQEEYAKSALERGEVVSILGHEQLGSALIDLYRKSKNDLEEGGANTLFLAVGFLKWKKAADDPKNYFAPLILLPIQLVRKSALSGVTMRLLEEESRFNLTLLELLRNDFSLTINGLDGELPTDENGIDVDGIWNVIRRAIRDIPGFEVIREVVIGTFSFAKYLMWKDLIDRTPQLMQNPLVKYLIERGQKDVVLEKHGEIIDIEHLDSKVSSKELFLPLPADSSQIAAVVASAKGRDFVLDGPPGTGKSQTIANMIAHNLALGRRVLFVAEKKAALDVVYRRLEFHGLGEFCLELHSNKTSKTDFLKQLERAWDVREMLTDLEWEEETSKVQSLRNKLNGVVSLLHKRWPNGLTLHHAMGRVIKYANAATPQFKWTENTLHSAEEMEDFRQISKRLELNYNAFNEFREHFTLITQTDWTNSWQSSIITNAKILLDKIEFLQKATNDLIKSTEFEFGIDDKNPVILGQIASFCELLTKASGINLSFMFTPEAPTFIERAFTAIEILKEIEQLKNHLSIDYPANSWQQVDVQHIHDSLTVASEKFWFFAKTAKKKVIESTMQQYALNAIPDLSVDLPIIEQLQSLLQRLMSIITEIPMLPYWNGLETDYMRLHNTLILAKDIRSRMGIFASSPQQLADIRAKVKALLVDANELLGESGIIDLVQNLQTALVEFNEEKVKFCSLIKGANENQSILVLQNCALSIIQHQVSLKAWSDWNRVRDDAISKGLQPMLDSLIHIESSNISFVDIFETAYCRWFASWVIDSEPLLHNFVSAEHSSDIESYRTHIDHIANLTVRYIRARLCGSIPPKNEVSKQGGFSVLKHELQKSRRHKSIRKMTSEMDDVMAKLAPCMLMSPISVAQFLPSNQELFDLVIFDEASQISPWDAIGVIARAKQVVIAGDPRQMPPTSFFNRGVNDVDDDTEGDMESILDECLAAGLYNHRLSWHYRSRHESLITFSNHHYYDGNLITFPSSETKQSAVQWRKVAGVYSKGKGRCNQVEAKAIVAETVKCLTDKKFIASGKSIGIITLNSEQQRLINDLLDKARQENPEIEMFFQHEREEPVVVKNLETVQGDERDLIMLSIGFGPTEPSANAMSMSFGPLNREGGWRRLNVALTRARQQMIVFTSFESSMIDLTRTNARAVADLKHFIEFAQRGPIAISQAVKGSVGSYDSPFEEAVADGLRRKGWHVIPQIGVSRFRIDLGIVHPNKPGDYLVGIECDGATYHSAATARDRDKVRSAILQGLGWKLLRLWSTEWWIDKEGALERLDRAIRDLLEESKAKELVQNIEKTNETSVDIESKEISLSSSSVNVVNDDNFEINIEMMEQIDKKTEYCNDFQIDNSELKYASTTKCSIGQSTQNNKYIVNDLREWINRVDAEKFYVSEYDETLKELIDDIIQSEAPLMSAMLVQRIARIHNFNRAGRLIRERVMTLVNQYYHVSKDHFGENFIWQSETQRANWNTYRLPATEKDVRQIDAIPYEEMLALVLNMKSDNKIADITRSLGIKRLTSQTRTKLELLIAK